MPTTHSPHPTLPAGQRCIHDFLLDQCADCRPVPPGLTATVFVSRAGQVFHRSADCRALLDGQATARYYGHTTSDAVRGPLNQARARGLSPCMVCFTAAYPR
jgi:hypothetical protein